MKTRRYCNAPAADAERCFRHRLQAELARRCAENPQYSLRAFSRDLQTDHATLSQILRGRRSLTEAAIRGMAERLHLEAAETERYVTHAPLFREVAAAGATTEAAQAQVTEAAVALITEWQHFAILELLQLETFQADSRWIARVLGLGVDEVNVALSRLCRLDLLGMEGADRWIDKSGARLGVKAFQRATIREWHEQMHRLRLAAVEAWPRGIEDWSSATFAVRTERVPEILARLAHLRAEIAALVETDAKKDGVYQLEIGFFPMTRVHESEDDERG